MPSGCPVTPGFPIRRSPDQSSFDSSPRLIAACHVLHRLSTPRHPPCALSSLATFMRDCRPAATRFLTRPRTSASCTGQTDFQRLRLPFDSPTRSKKPRRRTNWNIVIRFHKSIDLPTSAAKPERPKFAAADRSASVSSIAKDRSRRRTIRNRSIDGSPTLYPNPQRRQAARKGFLHRNTNPVEHRRR